MPASARPSDVLRALRRYLALVLLAALIGGAAAAAVSYRSQGEFTGTATYLVPPGELPGGDVVTPFDAERLARTYAVVIANDERLLRRLGRTLDRSTDGVGDRTTTTSLASSAAIRVQYRGDDRAEVRAYFDALTSELENRTPPTANVVPGSVRLLSVQDEIPQSGGGSWTAVLAGALCGLLVGGALATALDRSNPRVRTARDLREDRGPVVLDVDPGDGASLETLAHRMVADLPMGTDIAVLPATPAAQRGAERLAAELNRSAGSARWVSAPDGSGGERTAQQASRTLLVVAAGERSERVADRLSELHDVGVREVVLAVVSRRAAKAAPAPQPAASASSR